MILNTVLKVKGGRVNNSEQLIALKESETAFLKYFNKADYELVDFSVVEKLDWKQLNHEDLQQMGERNFWQHEHQIYALRNDFTDQLLRYYSMYPTAATKVAYTGLIIRNNEAAVQVGLENYAPSLANVQQSLKLFIQFIQQQLRDNVHFVVLGHYQLLDALLDKSLQTPDILSMIEERNLSGLVTYLSTEHPIVQILKENTQQQLNVLEHYIPNDHPALVELKIWERWLHKQGYKDIHLDITAQPPRSYYTGLFIQCHFAENESRVLTGGYYKGSIRRVWIRINTLSKGVCTMLRIAIAKGRLMDSLINYLDVIEYTTLSETLKNRERQLLLSVDNIECILVKGSDVPIYVEQGMADIGIVGSDILDERQYNVNNLLNMPFGACHFAVAAKPETTNYRKIATSYVHTAETYFKSKGIDVELIKLNGSVELACVVDMVDGIVDIVQTGTTLKANGLVEKQHISDINARLITNKAAYFKKSQLIEQFIRSLEVSIANA